MWANKSSLSMVLFKCIVSILLIYLLFTPVFYVFVVRSVSGFDANGWDYMLAHVFRFILVVLTGLFIRKKHRDTLFNYKAHRKIFVIFILNGIFISGLLNFLYIPPRFYGKMASAFGIYDVNHANLTSLFLPVLWEQLFDNYLIPSILLCLAIVFFYKPSRHHISQKNQETP